jgi:hypothetical protein
MATQFNWSTRLPAAARFLTLFSATTTIGDFGFRTLGSMTQHRNSGKPKWNSPRKRLDGRILEDLQTDTMNLTKPVQTPLMYALERGPNALPKIRSRRVTLPSHSRCESPRRRREQNMLGNFRYMDDLKTTEDR